MDYKEALEYIHGTLKFGWKLGLHNITQLLELMGNPQKKLRFVHVAGTNGKGSTVAFISSILEAAGLKTGIFTSPYIERFTERIRIGGEEIPEDDLARLAAFVKEKVDVMLQQGEKHPTEFEIITAIALQYYFENSCDIVVLEVGLGGRFDSTNVIDTPMVAVITTIDYDHTERLGKTLPEIAFEKAGIIKNGGDVVLYPHEPEVERVFKDVCSERKANMHNVSFASLEIINFNVDGQTFDYNGYRSLNISLLGEHQPRNASVALETVLLLRGKGLNITDEAIRKGLANARWPGRFELLAKNPYFLIDGAHNTEGAKVLAANLKKYFPESRITFIFGVLKDKDYKSILEAVLPVAHGFITVTPDSDRALSGENLAIFISPYCNNVIVSDTIEVAIRESLAKRRNDDVVCAFGSLYYIGGIRRYFRENLL